MAKKKFRGVRHTFIFHYPGLGDDDIKIQKWPVKVVQGKAGIKLTLTAADVKRSMNMNGVGNTQTCSMAICAKRQKDLFPHSVEGYIDWTYSRAYVVSRTRNGMPVECVVYRHDDKIAKLNDTKGGQQKLLKMLEEQGDQVISLMPFQKRPPSPQRLTGKKPNRPHNTPAGKYLKGGKARFAFANLGGV